MERGELLLPSLAPSEIGAVERVSSTEKERSLPRSPGDGRIGGGVPGTPRGRDIKEGPRRIGGAPFVLRGRVLAGVRGT